MHFVITAYDGKDENALERRLAVREKHLAAAKALHEKGNLLYASAILDSDGKMIGSSVLADFPSEAELHSQWLDNEPYVVGDVWRDIKIEPVRVVDFCLK